MTKVFRPLSAALALAVLPLTGTFAQSAESQWHMMRGAGPMLGSMAGGCSSMTAIMQSEDIPLFGEGRIAFLKAELAITDAQKEPWDAYAAALRANFQSMQDMRNAMRTTPMTPVERLHAHLTALDARINALQALKPSLDALYNALSAEQKKIADELLTPVGCMM